MSCASRVGKADLLIGQQRARARARHQRFRRWHEDAAQAHRVLTMEFPHLMRLMAENQFDTIYHEHF